MSITLGILLVLLPTYLIRFTLFGLPFTLLEILLLVFLLVVVGRLISQKKLINQLTTLRKLGPVNYAVGLFVLAAVIATLISPQPLKALGQLKAFIIEPVLFFYACLLSFKKTEDLKWPLLLLLSSSVVIGLFGIFQYFTLLNLPLRFWGGGLEPKRITSIFEYPNALALYLAPLFLFYLSLRKNSFLPYKKFLTFSLIVMAAALLLTFSRGAWLAVVVSILFLYLRRASWAKVLPAALVAILIFLSIPAVSQRLFVKSDPASSARVELTGVAVQKVLSSPLLGNGLYGFRATLASANFQGEILNYPHNIFLNFWLELGLLGLISFFAIIFFALSEYKKRASALKLAAAFYLLPLLLHGLVDVPYFKNDLAVLFWFIISLFFIDSE